MTNPTEITTNITETIDTTTDTITRTIEITKTTTETLTNVVTNVLDKIDIVSVDKIKDIPTDWVSFLGVMATMVSAFLMWRSVSEMKRQFKEQNRPKLSIYIKGLY